VSGCARRLLAAVALVLAVAGCRLDVNVGFDVEDDGSGVVRVAVGLDEDAARRVPDLADQLEVQDLIDAGWTVTGPALEGDGRTWIRASKPFGTPDEAGAVLAELSGEEGPFRDFRIERDRSFLAETWRFSGTVDLTADLEGFSDDALRERLDGTSFGVDAEELERRAGDALDRVFRFRVAAELPGSVSSNAPVDVQGGAVWTPTLGEQVTLAADGRVVDSARVIWLTIGALLAVATGIVLGWRLRRRERRERAT
jgi:hypothetical protein